MFTLAREPINVSTLSRALHGDQAGAMISFEGWVRNVNDGRAVRLLEYEACESLAVKEGARIIQEAQERFSVIEASCVHRIGLLAIGECAVWVGVTAEHRDAAFAACRYIVDQLKVRLPIWKKEHYADGSVEWVNCQSDEIAEMKCL